MILDVAERDILVLTERFMETRKIQLQENGGGWKS
jgi:hypothetical protein